MPDILKRFLSFDRLLGVGLVQIIFYVGLIGICGGILIGMMFAIVTLTSDIGGGVVQLVAIPAVGAVLLVLWRFICELFIVVFEMNERLGELRDAVYGAPPPPAPDAPQF